MSDENHPENNPEQPVQQIQHSSATARIPDEIGRGVFATAVIVLHGPNEYTIDFIQSLARPNRVAARIILPPVVANQFVLALEQALEARIWQQQCGRRPKNARCQSTRCYSNRKTLIGRHSKNLNTTSGSKKYRATTSNCRYL